MIIILIIFLGLIVLFRPWIDYYTDYRGVKHLILWYTNLKTNQRNFINLIGSQK